MSGAVQVEEFAAETWQATGTEGAPNLQQVAADRLAAHRQRRAMAAAQEQESEVRTRQHRDAMHSARKDAARRGASLVRDAVVARYQQRESYREFLAAEAERAISQAQAEAEVATRNARAVAEAQMALLQEFDEINRPEPGPREVAMAQQRAETRDELAHALADIVLGAQELIGEPPMLAITEAPAPQLVAAPQSPAVREVSASGLTVRLFEDIPAAPVRVAEARAGRRSFRGHSHASDFAGDISEEGTMESLSALEDEIDFRRSPEFALPAPMEVHAIPANLIEFPRELVAPRRARPRLAEGPLTDDPEEPQLRIFEVDAEQDMPEVTRRESSGMPEWQTLQLSAFAAEPAPLSSASDAQTQLALPLFTASVERRAMAAAVDLCCVGLAWLGAFACVAQIAGSALRDLSLPLSGAAVALSFALFAVIFQLLFFTLAEATPGMRYARIALCTFGDGNPSRRAMRRRVFSAVLAACPLGLGLLWMLLDGDKLGWHDRMSRMYQRAY